MTFYHNTIKLFELRLEHTIIAFIVGGPTQGPNEQQKILSALQMTDNDKLFQSILLETPKVDLGFIKWFAVAQHY